MKEEGILTPDPKRAQRRLLSRYYPPKDFDITPYAAEGAAKFRAELALTDRTPASSGPRSKNAGERSSLRSTPHTPTTNPPKPIHRIHKMSLDPGTLTTLTGIDRVTAVAAHIESLPQDMPGKRIRAEPVAALYEQSLPRTLIRGQGPPRRPLPRARRPDVYLAPRPRPLPLPRPRRRTSPRHHRADDRTQPSKNLDLLTLSLIPYPLSPTNRNLNMFGDAMRDLLDPRLRGSER